MSHDLNTPELQKLRWPLKWTRIGMFAEQIVRAFWPFWTLLLVLAASVFFEAHVLIGPQWRYVAFGVFGIALVVLAVIGLRRFEMPSRADAMVRLDTSLPGRPISAALDEQAIGTGDAASRAVWAAHIVQVKKRLTAARTVRPDLRVSNRDVFGLRYIALLGLVIAVGFGSLLRTGSIGDLADDMGGAALATGPAWEIWVEPPRYTDKPTLYLNDVAQDGIEVPTGSKVIVRLYGQPGALNMTQTISDDPMPQDVPQAFDLTVDKTGDISIAGGDERNWTITAMADEAPTVVQEGEVERGPDGEMRLTYKAADDYAVMSGTAQITLDLDAVDRRFGLAIDPEDVSPVMLDLPMPITGNRAEFTETMIENLAKHPFATLPVQIEMRVQDGANQSSKPAIIETTLPGRRFFQPIAKAIIEQRRDLLWSRENLRRVDQILRTITHLPDDFFPNNGAFVILSRVLTRIELERDKGNLSVDARDELAEMLWEAATLLEEGSLDDARERLRRAQERLSDAMQNGATEEEIAELMQELSDAMDQYMQQLAQEQERNGEQQQAQNGESTELSDETLQQMLDEIQRMMEEGDMEGAERLLAQLMEMMENLQIAEGGQGQGGQGQGQQSMEDLQDTLREQQGLSDEAFRDLQEQLNPDAQAGESQDNEGRNGGQGRGEQHEGQGGAGGDQDSEQQGQGDTDQAENQNGQGGGSLADRQEALRDELNRQSRNVPGAGTPEGDAARDALRRADEAMNRAEDALRDNQTADALGAQSDAMDALREGIRNLGDATADNDQQQQDGQPGQANSGAPSQQQDPLGREPGTSGAVGTLGQVPGGADARQRSRALLDEIRKRSGDQGRPEVERDYLERLLDQF